MTLRGGCVRARFLSTASQDGFPNWRSWEHYQRAFGSSEDEALKSGMFDVVAVLELLRGQRSLDSGVDMLQQTQSSVGTWAWRGTGRLVIRQGPT